MIDFQQNRFLTPLVTPLKLPQTPAKNYAQSYRPVTS